MLQEALRILVRDEVEQFSGLYIGHTHAWHLLRVEVLLPQRHMLLLLLLDRLLGRNMRLWLQFHAALLVDHQFIIVDVTLRRNDLVYLVSMRILRLCVNRTVVLELRRAVRLVLLYVVLDDVIL